MLIALVVALFHVMGAVSSVHAIMSTRTSQGAIAWAISLNTFPYVSVPAYWVFGRSRFHGYTMTHRDTMAQMVGVTETARRATQKFCIEGAQISPAGLAAEHLTGIPCLTGNSVELLVDGEATFKSILDGIDSAKEYILFQFFIIHDDAIGREVQKHLTERAKAGVRVSFLYDEIGCYKLPRRYTDELRAAGVEVYDFHTRKGPRNRFQINFRNHRKVVVVDGRVAWVGGHNVGDEYLGRNPKFGHWRDTHIRIEGPAALGAQFSFAADWYWATDSTLELNWYPAAAPDGDLPVLMLPSGPADELETANLMFVHAINSAKDRIWIASPYFVPDQAVVTALQLAGLRGVDVRILIPDRPDHVSVYLAAFSYFDEAGRTGVKFYRYQDGFLHQKVMLIDKSVATVGTANFDNRSFRLNFEITAVIMDEGFAGQVERMFETDFSKSSRIGPEEYSGKPMWFRFGVNLARLAAPLL